MRPTLQVLVTGATGRQGGATVRLLVERGHRVRALTRSPSSPRAQALASSGVELARGDLDDRASIGRALAGVDAMVLVATPFEAGIAAETRQGMTAADAAHEAGAFLVYSSVANADRQTGIPHFDSKFAVEEHIRRRRLDATIIAPAYFMENLWFGLPQLKLGLYGSALSPTRSLMQVAVSDIAATAVAVLEDRPRYAGKRYDLAGDDLTGAEEVKLLAAAIGRPLTYAQVPMDVIRKTMGDDGVKMYQWFENPGYDIDRDALRRDFPDVPWLSFERWARAQHWPTILSEGPTETSASRRK